MAGDIGRDSLNTLSDNTIRRGARNRVAKNKPDFVDPFSLRKTRKRKPLPVILSPVSTPFPDESVVEENEMKLIKQRKLLAVKKITLKVKLVPLKKRAYLREPWQIRKDYTPTASCSVQPDARSDTSMSRSARNLRPRTRTRGHSKSQGSANSSCSSQNHTTHS